MKTIYNHIRQKVFSVTCQTDYYPLFDQNFRSIKIYNM